MRNFLKIHWFGFIVSVFAVFYLTVFLLVLFAPREDKLNRGFIPCTKTLASEIFACEQNKAWCMSKAIVKNTWCDTLVVLDGFGAWVCGRQKTPWASYLFTPELLAEEPQAEELQQFYAENPDIAADMQKLHQDRQKLEQDLADDFQTEQKRKDAAANALQNELKSLSQQQEAKTETPTTEGTKDE